MKLTGTDASVVTADKYQEVKPAVKVSKVDPVDGKFISQITNADKQEMPISEKTLIDAIERANKAISGYNRVFEYSVHKATKEVMVKVIDTDTNQVVREIPPEKILDLIAKIWEMAGIMVDERR